MGEKFTLEKEVFIKQDEEISDKKDKPSEQEKTDQINPAENIDKDWFEDESERNRIKF